MLGIPLGLLYSNAGEWFIHKFALHGLGRKRDSTFAFHWHEHHRESRKREMRDPGYEVPAWARSAQRKELVGLLALAAAHAPLWPIAPWFTATVWASALNYYRVHKRSHKDPAWAREHLPWHYDHHMGPNQHANWCVTFPWFDHVMGTREPYVGTEREANDRARASRPKAARGRDRAASEASAAAGDEASEASDALAEAEPQLA